MALPFGYAETKDRVQTQRQPVASAIYVGQVSHTTFNNIEKIKELCCKAVMYADFTDMLRAGTKNAGNRRPLCTYVATILLTPPFASVKLKSIHLFVHALIYRVIFIPPPPPPFFIKMSSQGLLC